ncbi:MAG: iron ABC transporter permease [Sphaerochaeta sp.]|nr:iron ABC transporter permease [Sphaerochaeta sp.]
MRRPLVAVLAALSLILALIALTLGPSGITLGETVHILLGQRVVASKHYIIWHLRLPRIIASFLTGAVLGFSGAIYQASLRNPMADPFILGVSSGASFGVAVALALGLSTLVGFPLSALVGSVVTTLLILALSLRQKGATTTLILTGVAINYVLSAAMTLLMFMNKEQYQRILFWSMGSFSTATWGAVMIVASALLLLALPLSLSHRSLDMLLLDESSGQAAGLSVGSVRLMVLLPASIATALCVSHFGVIGFIGLMAPHVSRLLVGPRHKRLLAPSALFGGLLLLASDTLARLLLPSGELPVGVITSLVGVPLFIYLLRRGRYRYG